MKLDPVLQDVWDLSRAFLDADGVPEGEREDLLRLLLMPRAERQAVLDDAAGRYNPFFGLKPDIPEGISGGTVCTRPGQWRGIPGGGKATHDDSPCRSRYFRPDEDRAGAQARVILDERKLGAFMGYLRGLGRTPTLVDVHHGLLEADVSYSLRRTVMGVVIRYLGALREQRYVQSNRRRGRRDRSGGYHA